MSDIVYCGYTWEIYIQSHNSVRRPQILGGTNLKERNYHLNSVCYA